MSHLSAAAEGSNLLSMIAPAMPTIQQRPGPGPFMLKSSSVMLFSRKEASGIPQKSVMMACSSTTLARVLAASPVASLELTLRHMEREYVKGSGRGFALCLKVGHVGKARKIGVKGR